MVVHPFVFYINIPEETSPHDNIATSYFSWSKKLNICVVAKLGNLAPQEDVSIAFDVVGWVRHGFVRLRKKIKIPNTSNFQGRRTMRDEGSVDWQPTVHGVPQCYGQGLLPSLAVRGGTCQSYRVIRFSRKFESEDLVKENLG